MLFYMESTNGHHTTSTREEIVSWLTPEEIHERYTNNDLAHLISSNENNHELNHGTNNNEHEENARETILNPPLVRLNDTRENHENRNKQSPCGDGTQCKRQRDVSKVMWEESLKNHILKSLNMSSPPNISENDMLPDGSLAVREMLEDMQRLDIDHERDNEVRKSGKLISIGKRRKLIFKLSCFN